jgi:predicted permease
LHCRRHAKIPEPMDRLLAIAVPFFGPILIGYVAGKWTKKPADGLAWLNFFVIYVALPPVFYQVIAKTPFEQLSNPVFFFGTTLSSYIAYALAFAFAFFLVGWRVKEAAIAGGIGGYGNVGYMGPGLAVAVMGPEAAAPMALVFLFDCLMFLILIPLLIATDEDGSNLRQTLVLIVKRVAFNPFIIAIFVGLAGAYFQIRLPEPIERTFDFLKAASAPAALFALGVTVALRPAGALPVETVLAVVIKLLVHPVIVYLMLSMLGSFPREWIYTAVLMAALPPALTSFVLATQYNIYVDRASTAVLVGTMLSMPTLIGWLWLIEHNIIPLDLFP